MAENNDRGASQTGADRTSAGGASYGSHGDQQQDRDRQADRQQNQQGGEPAESGVQAGTGIGDPRQNDATQGDATGSNADRESTNSR